MEVEKKFDLSFGFGKAEHPQTDLFWAIMQIIDASFLPNIEILESPDKRPQHVSSATDKKVLQAIQKEIIVELSDKNKNLKIVFFPFGRINLIIALHRDIVEQTEPNAIINLFKLIIHVRPPVVAKADFFTATNQMWDKYYQQNPRTRQASGLLWLQYYGEEEYIKQGGEAIFNNPYIKTERIAKGVLIQVGDSPFNSLTEPGQQALLSATKAMPPFS